MFCSKQQESWPGSPAADGVDRQPEVRGAFIMTECLGHQEKYQLQLRMCLISEF